MRRLGTLGLSLLTAASLAVAGSVSASAGTVAPLVPPIIHEDFTPLPCNQTTTLGLEGCAEHQLLRADQRIDREVRLLFGLLHDNAARGRLSTAQRTWLAYRRADCLSQSDIYEGGTQAAVEFGACAVSADLARSADLHGFYRGLVQGRHDAPAFP